MIDELQRLHNLYVSGAMTADEYDKAVSEFLEGEGDPERANLWMRCPNCEQEVEVLRDDRINTPRFVATCQHCGLVFDWRLAHNDFLRGATLDWEEYLAPSEAWDHDHCALCWQKFMEARLPGVDQAGYVTYTNDAASWICKQCFEDLHEEMGWQVASREEPPAEPGAAPDRGGR